MWSASCYRVPAGPVNGFGRPSALKAGFSLAELLLAMLILAVIATFSIPKVLHAQSNNAWNAAAKEAAAALSEAYMMYRLEKAPSAATTPADLTHYLNYVAVDTQTDIDHLPTYIGPLDCGSADRHCLRLHNGSILRITEFNHFCSENPNQYIFFVFDPDGKYSGAPDGPGGSIQINVYYNGRINISSEVAAGDDSCLNSIPQGWGPDPASPWFSW